MKAQSDTPMDRVRMDRVLGWRQIVVFAVVVIALSFTVVPRAHAQLTTTDSDRVRDSLLALPSYRREYLQTHPAMYERYKTPGLCLASLWRSMFFYDRDKRPDTVFSFPFERKISSISKQVGRACIGKFDVEHIPKEQLPALLPIYLSLDEPRLFERAYSRILTEFPTRDTAEIRLKANILMRVWNSLVTSPLSDWTLMNRLADDIDSLGPSVARYSVRIHDAGQWVRAKLDPDAGIAAIQKAIAAFKKMPLTEIADWGGFINKPYEEWAKFLFWKEGRPERPSELFEKEFVPTLAAFSSGSPEAIAQLRRTTERWIYPYTFYGQPAPPALAKHWFYPNAADTGTWSWEGQPTLVMFVRSNCGGGCYAQYSLAKMIHKKFGARGLRILFVTSTQGFFRKQLPETPAQEVELIRKYYHEFLEMPVILAIDESRFNRLPDGRRIPEDVPWTRSWPVGSEVLVGRDGIIKSLVSVRSDGVPRLISEIEKVL